MTKVAPNPKVDAYLRKAKTWQPELKKLRSIALGCGLTEELKWGKPTYAFEKSNVVIIIPLKETCALAFAKGALLRDAKGLLIRPGQHTQAGRWLKFANVREITKLERLVRAYILEAVEIARAGLDVEYKQTWDYEVAEEFAAKLDASPRLKEAFEALTPGRQRGYLLYFSAAKQSKTRAARVAKCTPQILRGKGLNDPPFTGRPRS